MLTEGLLRTDKHGMTRQLRSSRVPRLGGEISFCCARPTGIEVVAAVIKSRGLLLQAGRVVMEL